MSKLTAITCTHERPEAFELCKRYMARQTRQPDQWLILDGPEPMPKKILGAIESGSIQGDHIVFFEDDDWVREDWLAWCSSKLDQGFDLVGEGNCYYYHVSRRWWSCCRNVRHAALFQTAIRREMLDIVANLIRGSTTPFFDTRLWFCDCNKYLFLPKNLDQIHAVGVKGMPGKQGYSGEHRSINPAGVNLDWPFAVLPKMIGEEDAERYEKFFDRPALRHHRTRLFSEMRIHAHILTHDAEQMLPWALRHYRTFCTKVWVHDGGPLRKSSEMVKDMPDVEACVWDTAGQLNDYLARHLKNECWKGTDADWVMIVDADEILWFPDGPKATFESWAAFDVAMVRPLGCEMFSETWHEAKDYPEQVQIHDLIHYGASDDKWYAKPVLFSPTIVAESGIGIGAHDARPVLHDGRALVFNEQTEPTYPNCFLLHFHQIGPIERVAQRYDDTRKRLAAINVRENWGNVYDTGLVHAQKKRDLILPNLRRIIP